MAGDTYVYFDALNFYYGAVRFHPEWKWVDFEALSRTLVPADTIGRIRYFTAQVRPQYPDDRSPERHNVLIRAVEANPLIEVHKGHFSNEPRWRGLADVKFVFADLFRPHIRPAWAGRAMFAEARRRRTHAVTLARVMVVEEKRSDVNLAAHLVNDAVKGDCSKAIVISNDSDLKEPIVLAREAGVEVGIVNPHSCATNRRLRQAATFEIPFRPEALAKCQLANTVIDAKGRELHRPQEWR